MRILANIRVIPIGTCSSSIGDHVKKAVEVLRNHGINYVVTPFSTAFEIESLDELAEITGEIINILKDEGVNRVAIDISLDLRFDKEISLDYKVKRVVIS
ncbi:MAG: MTH1187 family thiamine-binding protein [Thermosphaera sp.]